MGSYPKRANKNPSSTLSSMTESYQYKTKKNKVTVSLTYENAHVPISVSVVGTLERESKHIGDPNSKELIRKFLEELERRGKIVEPR